MKRRNLLLLSAVWLSMVLPGIAVAQETGKIAGTVRDKKTGEQLIGANVSVKGTPLGATTDVNGFYYILRVPPGVHDLQVSLVGYTTTTVRGVRVQRDLTAEINVKIEQSSVELEEILITAEQKIVQKDVTSTRRTVSSETMRETPGMESMSDIFKLTPSAYFSAAPPVLKLGDGVQISVRDESLQDVHIRGGRGGEILYMVDGMPITHPLYGGRSVMDLNLVDVESVELLTGAFNAEYGQAQSGVVNVSTRSGGTRYQGGVEYKTDNLEVFGESYNTDYGSFYLGGPEPITQYLLPAVGLSLPGTLTFFVSGNLTMTNTTYDNNRTRSEISVFGIPVTARQDNSENFNAKLKWDISPSHRLAFGYHGTQKQWSNFDYAWAMYPDGTPEYNRDNETATLQWNHVLSLSTYYSVNFGYLGVAYNGSWDGKSPADYWSRDSTGKLVSMVNSPQIDPKTGFYDERGTQAIWRDDDTETYTLRADLTSQVHPAHLLKTGVELQWNRLSYVDIQDGAYKLSRYGQGIDSLRPPGPYSDFGLNRWVFNTKPLIGAAYIQDKFELEYLILNAGFRIDWFMMGEEVMTAEWKSLWERATGLTADWDNFTYKVSPRFGVSFPISEFTVLFFSYGHFNQLPELQYYYRDPYSGAFAGNPNLNYEQTILYEFGVTHQLADAWAVDLKSYAKDISNQVGTTRVYGSLGTPVDLYDNKGYGRALGLEFQLMKRYEEFTSLQATYTVQWATGYSSSAFDDYVRSTTNFPYPIRERPLEWDVRHQVIFTGTVAAPPGRAPSLFGLSLFDDFNLTVLFRFYTGPPYTPGPATLNPVERQKQENTAIGPSASTTDLKFEKGFTLWGVRLGVTFDVFNLFNQQLVQTVRTDLGFNPWTGEPFRYGDVQKPQQNFYDYYTMISLRDPRVYAGGRTTKIGIRLDF